MLPAMHYRLRYRQLIIEQISVLTIVIEVAAAPPTPEAGAASSTVFVPPVSGGMPGDALRPWTQSVPGITTQSIVTNNEQSTFKLT